MDLFHDVRQKNLDRVAPLAVRMRPRTLDEFAGQQHFLGPGMLLRRMLEADRLTSVIFYGPPGTGKTTLAQLIAHYTASHFEQVNAAAVGVKEVRGLIEAAKERLGNSGRRTVLFLDEIHRFNRAQQDILLPDVESGHVLLVGATTENPFFSVNSPLVSRSQIFQFRPLDEAEIKQLVVRAATDSERGFGKLNVEIDEAALNLWATMSDGDARRALMGLEVAVLSQVGKGGGEEGSGLGVQGSGAGEGSGVRVQGSGAEGVGREGSGGARNRGAAAAKGSVSPSSLNPEPRTPNPPSPPNPEPQILNPSPSIRITLNIAEQSMQRKAIVYDGTGDEHYDAASALIKSMRGSDPDAAVYWVARMLEAGEDPRFIARRIAILASEDIGNADPQAIVVACAAYQIVERIGMPEAQLTLSQAAIYMSTAPKSNASAEAIWEAMKDVREGRTLPVPIHLKDGHYSGAARLGHGVGYQYPHDSEGGFVRQDYLGVDKTYYRPTERGHEASISERLNALRKNKELKTEELS